MLTQPLEWEALRPTTPWGLLPSLSWNGEIIYESLAIARFLAREFGLMGRTSLESAQVEKYTK